MRAMPRSRPWVLHLFEAVHCGPLPHQFDACGLGVALHNKGIKVWPDENLTVDDTTTIHKYDFLST